MTKQEIIIEKLEISFQKLCDTADDSLKRYEQLMYKKLDKK